MDGRHDHVGFSSIEPTCEYCNLESLLSMDLWNGQLQVQ